MTKKPLEHTCPACGRRTFSKPTMTQCGGCGNWLSDSARMEAARGFLLAAVLNLQAAIETGRGTLDLTQLTDLLSKQEKRQ